MTDWLFRHIYGDQFEVHSAGTKPSTVRSMTVCVMAEIGIDFSGHNSKGFDGFLDREIDFVVTLCDGVNEACPFFPGDRIRMYKGFRNPYDETGTEEEILDAFRSVRDEISAWISGEVIHLVKD